MLSRFPILVLEIVLVLEILATGVCERCDASENDYVMIVRVIKSGFDS